MKETKTNPKTETATFGAGCFWHVQLAFDNVKGIIKTEVGYTGGKMENPKYEDVCTDETGHVEVCQVEFDPKQISYDEILNAFWNCHDLTQVDGQGPDEGTQYRSVIFYHNTKQKELAEKSKKKLDASKKYNKPIATAIEPAKTFYKAEDYHQKYLSKRGRFTCG